MLIHYPFRFLKDNIKRGLNIPSSPFLLNYSVTFRCILDCKYCGVARLNNNLGDEELTAQDVSAFLKDRMLKKLKVIVISGGEPFFKDDLAQILLEFKKLVSPYIFHITTNGFLTDKIVESIKFLKKNGLNIVLKVSVDDIADKHDLLRNNKGSFDRAVDTVRRLRGLFNSKELPIGINQTIFEENYRSIPEVGSLAKNLSASYRGFVGLRGRPLYTGIKNEEYGLVELSDDARSYIADKFRSMYNTQRPVDGCAGLFDEMVIRHYIGGQIRMLENNKPIGYRCMSLFTHFRLNPNGDIITCSYDLDVLGNVKKESYSSIISKKQTRDKLDKVKGCGRCWLGCEVTPSWVSSLFIPWG
ncbi:MAG: radical SAM protein [Candidatus Omnitrophota bacterium]